ncbi:hypothetical protein [Salinibacter ruber]|uniref:hypothetical protein n=1 Tax=Salinibacter ruber TaxID=146919 RepID=UPI00216950BE|nr:hypothetical protein [Salinibacter ruber]MCS4198354.1 hypothetical protein [Salinibacter ruber]
MGQQQLLLLVLSTVIVGLATVAGIQAFDEGQNQATQDALTQRALSIGNDLYAVSQKPSQLGGIDLGGNAADAAKSAGFSSDEGISAEGVGGQSPSCDIESSSSNSTFTVKCGSNDATGGQTVQVVVDSDGPSLTQVDDNDITSS